MLIDCSSLASGLLLGHAFCLAVDDQHALRSGGCTIATSQSDLYTAVAVSSVLTVQRRAGAAGSEFAQVFDLEFTDEIDAVALDRTGECVIVGDCKHTLHFVTADGVLIFSNKVRPVDPDTPCAQFLYIGFMKMSAESEQQCLLALLSDGSIVGIADLPVKNIASMARAKPSAASLAAAIKRLNFHRTQMAPPIASLPLQKACLVSTGDDGQLAAVFIDSKNSLRLASVGSTAALETDASSLACSGCDALRMKCSDFVVLGGSLVGVLSNNRQLSLLDASRPIKAAAPLFATQLDATFDQIAASTTHGESGAMVFIMSSSSDGRAAMYCLTHGAGPLLLLGQCWSGAGVQFDNFNSRNGLVLDVADSVGGAVAVREVARPFLGSLAGLTDARCAAVPPSEFDSFPSPRACLHFLGSVLLCPLEGADRLERVERAVRAASPHTSLLCALFNAALVAPHPEKGFLRALLAVCKDAAGSSSSSSSAVSSGRSNYFFTCASEALSLVEGLTEGEEPQRALLLQMCSPAGRLIAWRAAAVGGDFDTARALLRAMRIFGDDRPDERASEVLDILSRTRQPCNLDGLVQLVSQRRCALLSERLPARSAVLLKIAMHLCDAARASEQQSASPFAAVAAVELAADIAQAVGAEGAVTAERLAQATEHIASLLTALRLQRAVRLHWGATTSLDEVLDRGLSSLVNRRLGEVPEQALPAEIRERIAPLASEFGSVEALTTDDLLLKWIGHAVQNRVITSSSGAAGAEGGALDNSRDSDAASDDDDGDDGASTSSVSRLVVVADMIVSASKKTQAVLLLLQLPNIGRAVVSSSSPPVSCAEHMCTVAESLLAAGAEGPLREALQETLKLYSLRSITARYGIHSLDPRDPSQVRAALLLISAKMASPLQDETPSAVSGPIHDTLQCAEACSASSNDVCGLLARAVIHRAAGGACSAHAVRLALLAAPCSRIAAAAEDACSYLLGELEEACSEEDAAAAVEACAGAVVVVSTYLDAQGDTSSCGRGGSWLDASLLAELKRLRALQSVHGLLLSLPQLRSHSHCCEVIAALAEATIAQGEQAGPATLTPAMRGACGLVAVSPVFAVHAIVRLLLSRGSSAAAIEVVQELLSSGGMDCSSEEDNRLAVELAVQLSSLSAKTQLHGSSKGSAAQASALAGDLLRRASAGCNPDSLASLLDLLAATDLVSAVYRRVEGADGAALPGGVQQQMFRVAEATYSRDGILMSPQAVAGPLLRFSLRELRRRSEFSPSGGGGSVVSHPSSLSGDDVDALVRVLQSSENHMLATRVLQSTWSRAPASARGQQARASLLALSRKILSYREIDAPLAVAALAGLPFEAMVRELKAAVPSIQSDFSRLRTVAVVGEELSRAWGAEQLLDLFKGLQMNARWWHVLASLGVQVDPRAFQSSDVKQREACIRSVVPQLLQKSGMDLEKATEYCRQFDLETEFAALCYMEMLLLLPPRAGDSAWIGLVRRAASRIDEASLLALLRSALRRLHPLDFERVHYVCAWLLDLLDTDAEDGNEDNVTVMGAAAVGRALHAQELQEYRRLVDVAALLGGLQLPAAVSAALPEGLLCAGRYAEAPDSHRRRLPLWPLLADPWGVLEALMAVAPAALAARLSPLCEPLGLSRDDLYVRRICVCYSRMDAPQVADALSLISGALRRIEALKWIFSFEKDTRGDEAAASRALSEALSLAERGCRDPDGEAWAELDTARLELTNELVLLRTSCTVAALQQLVADSYGRAGLPPPPDAPVGCYARSSMFQCCFDVVLEAAWELQLAHLRTAGGVLCVEDVLSRQALPAVAAFLVAAGELLRELDALRARLPSAERPPQADAENILPHVDALQTPPGEGDSGGKVGSRSPLEQCRQNLTGRLLADVDSAAILSASSCSGAAARGKSARVAVRSSALAWKGSGGSDLCTSAHEARRREDCYLSFSLCALLTSSAVPAAGVAQLDSLARGRAARSMRRLTARSKFRAAQAVRFMPTSLMERVPLDSASSSSSGGGSASSGAARLLLAMSVEQLCCYYRCLSDVQETRLTCSEDVLLSALLDGGTASALSLVRTWLHDEGELAGILLLSRDVLLAAGLACCRTWESLLQRMASQQLHGAVLNAMCAARGGPCMRALLDEGALPSIREALAAGAAEAARRARAMLDAGGGGEEAGAAHRGAVLVPRLGAAQGGSCREGAMCAEDLVLLAEQLALCHSLLREHGVAVSAGDFDAAMSLLAASSPAGAVPSAAAAAVACALDECAFAICLGEVEDLGAVSGPHDRLLEELFAAAGAHPRAWRLFSRLGEQLGGAAAQFVLSRPWMTSEVLASLFLGASCSWSCGSADRLAAGALLAWCSDGYGGADRHRISSAAAALDRAGRRALAKGAEALLSLERRAGLLAAMQQEQTVGAD